MRAVSRCSVRERACLHPQAPVVAGVAGAAADAPNAAGAAESPADVVWRMMVLAAATVVLGVANVVIVTHVLEPGV